MTHRHRLAFVVPSLNTASAQREEVMQLLLFAATRLEDEIEALGDGAPTGHVISVDGETDGWERLSALFPERARARITMDELEAPETPNLAMASHKPAYDLFEFLKDRSYDEIHSLDAQGLAYYPTQAKSLGLDFTDTLFVTHVVGGSLFRLECEDRLLDDIGVLMDDLLERGSLERADVVYVHDRRAWAWYQGRIDPKEGQTIHDLSWAGRKRAAGTREGGGDSGRLAVVYHGDLSAADGLPLFCDMIDRVPPETEKSVHVYFVGTPRPVSGMDAVSYIRIRSARWRIPVTVKRSLSLADEVAFVASLGGVVFYHAVRRESLRSRLLFAAGVRGVGVFEGGMPPDGFTGTVASANPGELVRALEAEISAPRPGPAKLPRSVVDLWREGRPRLSGLETATPVPPLRLQETSCPKVSVCVTHYDRPKMLRRALDSLRAQTYQNFEVIVVDDGTPDPASKRQLKEIEREIGEYGWTLLMQPNRYLGAARNTAARHASGDYLLFMDDDNVAKPHEIETLVAVAQRTDAHIVTAFCDVFSTEDELDGGPPRLRFTPFGPDPALGALSNCYGDANALYARQAFEELGGFTEDYGITHEDWEFFCKASLSGMKMVCVPEPLFWYRMDADGMFRGERTQLHKSANLRRHIRPFSEKLPHYQSVLVQLAQGLSTQLPMTTVGARTRSFPPRLSLSGEESLPYARVAVVTRTRDRPLLLRRAIQSVLDQTFKDCILVIVNDGGNSEACEMVVDQHREELGERLLLVHHPVSLGMQVASNVGISRCDSDFIVIHDDDDSWDPTFLARMVSRLDERSHRVGGVVCWSQLIVEELDEDGGMAERDRFIHNDRLEGISMLELAVENLFPPIAFLFRRASFDAVGAFEERFGVLGDWEFNLRMLRRFEIEVIPEPLANYHHRSQSTTGDYGNSVHAQNEMHRAKRVDLLNTVLREGETENGASALPQALALGDLRHEQRQEFERLRQYLWTFDQHVRQKLSKVDTGIEKLGKSLGVKVLEDLDLSPVAGGRTRSGRNLVRNGDFRFWPDQTVARKSTDGDFHYMELGSGLVLIQDGGSASFCVDRTKWTESGGVIPYGKAVLHVENERPMRTATFFALSYVVPSALLMAGRTICVSGVSRLVADREEIHVGGRYDLGLGSRLEWPDRRVPIGRSMARWACVIACPSVEPTEVAVNHSTTVLIKLPHDLRFSFDLTELQIEIGNRPTEFEYL